MSVIASLRDHRTGDGLGELTYSDFSGGLNDTVTPIALPDKEVAVAENVDFSTEVKAFCSRKGTAKVNRVSFGAEVTDGFCWTVGQQYKKCIVMNRVLYDLNPVTGTTTRKIKLNGDEIYPWVFNNRLYFGDGSELYVWGDFDYSTEAAGEENLKYDPKTKLGTIIRFNGDEEHGEYGHFYMSLENRLSVDIPAENYLDTDNWEDVTDTPSMISNIVRPLPPVNKELKERFEFQVLTGINSPGKIAFCLDNEFYHIEFEDDEEYYSIEGAVQKIKEGLLEYEEFDEGGKWKLYEPEGNTLIIEATEAKPIPDAFMDLGQNDYYGAIIEISWETTVQGRYDNNDFAPIRKCTMFWLHNGSMRVFAGGNPDENALYYSDVQEPDYWNSAINKVHPGSGYGQITGLIEVNSHLLVSYQNGWYSWSGIDPIEDARWKELAIPYGCSCNRSIARTPYSFTFLSRDGIYSVQASILNIEYTLTTSKGYIKQISGGKVENAVRSIENHKKCRGVFWENAYYLAYRYVPEEPENPNPQIGGYYEPNCGTHCFDVGKGNNSVLKYEWDTASWAKYAGWHVTEWLTDAEGLFFCTDNYVLKTGEGYSDVNTRTGEKKAIDVLVRTKDFIFGSPGKIKETRLITFVFKQFLGYEDSTVDILVRAGYGNYKVLNIDINESLIYGRSWGKRWGWRDEQIKVAEVQKLGDTFSIEFRHSQIDRPIALLAISFAYRTIKRILPRDANLLKDEALNPMKVKWR